MARRTLRASMVLLLAALVLVACGGSDETTEGIVDATTTPANPLSGEVETLDGSSIDLGSLRGQDVVLWFWAPW